MLKKILIIPIIFLLILNISYSADDPDPIGEQCSTAAFCDGGYELVCSRESDGLCPQAYGNWNSCDTNIYEGVKCFPCDPDCGAYGVCGSIEASINPQCPAPEGAFTVPTYVENEGNIQLIVAYKMSNTCINPNFGSYYAALECPQEYDFCNLIQEESKGVISASTISETRKKEKIVKITDDEKLTKIKKDIFDNNEFEHIIQDDLDDIQYESDNNINRGSKGRFLVKIAKRNGGKELSQNEIFRKLGIPKD